MSNDQGEKKMIIRPKSATAEQAPANTPVIASPPVGPEGDSPTSSAKEDADPQPVQTAGSTPSLSVLPDSQQPAAAPSPDTEAASKPSSKPEANKAQVRKFVMKRPGQNRTDSRKQDEGPSKSASGGASATGSKSKFRFGKKGAVSTVTPVAAAPQPAAPVVPAKLPWKSIIKKLVSILKLAAVILLVGGTGALVYWVATRGTTAGHFGAIMGQVEVINGARTYPAKAQGRIVSGDSIRSHPESSACVMVGNSDADSMQVYENSTATLKVVKRTQTAPEGRLVNLENGMIDMDVMSAAPGRTIMVRTTNAVVAFNTGRFLLTCTNGYTELNVREGPVSIAQRGNEDQALSVEAGLWVGVGMNIPFEKKSLSGETEICSLFLIDSNDGQPAAEMFADPLKSEVVLDRNKVTGSFGIRATTVPAKVGSVKFEMDGCPVVVVNDEPYIFRGKPGAGVGDGWKPDRGNLTLTVTAYSKKDGAGKSSVPRTILFKVKGTVEY